MTPWWLLPVKTGASRESIKSIASNRVSRVEGINLVKRHAKPESTTSNRGGIVQKEASIHISNVALLKLNH